MALIERHPDVEDYIVELTLADIAGRGGVADLIEDGKLIIVKDYRLAVDTSAIAALDKSTESLTDEQLRRHIKKLHAPEFFEGPAPSIWRRPALRDPLRQALLDTLCKGDRSLFVRAGEALRRAHDEALKLFDLCFAGYQPFRLVPSVRLTQTLFENLHWDDHSIDDDFHQARIFANLDDRPRIWQVSHPITAMMRLLYEEHDLGRFAGRDPNEMLHYINSKILGGMSVKWLDTLPRHRIAFEPGEVWLGESRLISHQIYYGEAALVYMWFVSRESMKDPGKRFNHQVEQVHAEMRAAPPSRAIAAN